MGHLATLISDLALLLVVAGIATLLCKKSISRWSLVIFWLVS